MGSFAGYFGIIDSGLAPEELQNKLRRLPAEDHAVIVWKVGAKWLPYFDKTFCEGCGPDENTVRQLSQKLELPVLAFSLYDSDALYLYHCDAKAGVCHCYARANSGTVRELFGETSEEMGDLEQFLLSTCEEGEEQQVRDYLRQVEENRPHEELPEFLLPLCDEAALREVWEREDYVFADERLADLCAVLHSMPLNDADNIPEEFRTIRAEDR